MTAEVSMAMRVEVEVAGFRKAKGWSYYLACCLVIRPELRHCGRSRRRG